MRGIADRRKSLDLGIEAGRRPAVHQRAHQPAGVFIGGKCSPRQGHVLAGAVANPDYSDQVAFPVPRAITISLSDADPATFGHFSLWRSGPGPSHRTRSDSTGADATDDRHGGSCRRSRLGHRRRRGTSRRGGRQFLHRGDDRGDGAGHQTNPFDVGGHTAQHSRSGPHVPGVRDRRLGRERTGGIDIRKRRLHRELSALRIRSEGLRRPVCRKARAFRRSQLEGARDLVGSVPLRPARSRK
jgi:hypothetical protein